jgi:hypothetical protein
MFTTLQAAQYYAQRFGWNVLPVNRHKRPTTPNGFYDATTQAKNN